MGAFYKSSAFPKSNMEHISLGFIHLPHLISAAKRQIKPVELQQYFEVINTGTQNKA